MNDPTAEEICCVCGRSVAKSSPLFVNRVPELNDPNVRADIGRKFPIGDWVCAVCDATDCDGVVRGVPFPVLSPAAYEELLNEIQTRLRWHRSRWN